MKHLTEKFNRLNLQLLRGRAKGNWGKRNQTASAQTIASVFDERNSFELSRRKWLGMASSAALLASPALKKITDALHGKFVFAHEKNSASFSLGGKERWRIDTKMFCASSLGLPELSVEQTASRITLSLRNARFVGTALPADFMCVIEEAMFGWIMQLKFSFADAFSKTPFESWLLQNEMLDGKANFKGNICTVNNEKALRLLGKSTFSFSPDWSLDFSGKEIVSLSGFGEAIYADALALRTGFKKHEKSLMSPAPQKRTVLEFYRGERQWNFLPELQTGKQWQPCESENAFDCLTMEVAENTVGEKRIALQAASLFGQNAALKIMPSPALLSTDDNPFSLSIKNAHYAAAFGVRENHIASLHAALFGIFSSEKKWLKTDTQRIEFGSGTVTNDDTTDDSTSSDATINPLDRFELVAKNGAVESVKCRPKVNRIEIPLPDALTTPTKLAPDSRFAFVNAKSGNGKSGNSECESTTPTVGMAVLDEKKNTATVQVAVAKIMAIRPEDFVAIEFEFKNMSVSDDRRQVQRTASPAFMIVRFQPQYIAEQTVPEDNTESAPPPPPLKAALAGESRLVFIVPPSVNTIELKLETLLDKCRQYQLSLTMEAAALSAAQEAILKNLEANAAKTRGEFQQINSEAKNTRQNLIAVGANGNFNAVATSGGSIKTMISQGDSPLGNSIKASKGVNTGEQISQSLFAAQDAGSFEETLAFYDDIATRSENKMSSIGVGQAEINLAPLFMVPTKPGSQQPSTEFTLIEAPWRLGISPNKLAQWSHKTLPVAEQGRVELWHTRLDVRFGKEASEEEREILKTIRAIWSPNYNANNPATPLSAPADVLQTTLTPGQRNQLVHLTSNFKINGYVPMPVKAETLILSGLGAWLNLRGNWTPPMGLSVESWIHRGTMGRDHYVRIVEKGFLFPFGHQAVLVTVSERKFQKNTNGKVGAYLRKKQYIVVRQTVKDFPATGQDETVSGIKNARAFPYRRLRILTLVTPPLSDAKTNEPFWVMSEKKDFHFQFKGEDWEGQESEFNAPVRFVPASSMTTQQYGSLGNEYRKSDNQSRRRIDMQGQTIAFAISRKPGETSFETYNLLLDADFHSTGKIFADGSPSFYPIITEAETKIKAVELLTGKSNPRKIKFYDTYLKKGFSESDNKGGVFASLVEPININFSSDTSKSGGFLSPSMDITGLSNKLGAVAGRIDDVTKGASNAADVFGGMLDKAKLFGTFGLSEIIDDMKAADFDLSTPGSPKRVPVIQSRRASTILVTEMIWQPRIIVRGSVANILKTDNTALDISVRIETPLNGNAPKSAIEARLTRFALELVAIRLPFKEIKFVSRSGEKADVAVDMGDLEFLGALSFVNELRKYIPSDGFVDPPFLDVSTSGILAGYTLGIPAIGVGAFTLQNISLTAALNVPFLGAEVSFDFHFCKPENPFLLTVLGLGGGGYFGIGIAASGITFIAAALEAGASVALNLGVAAGAVTMMLGVYFRWEAGDSKLDGYLRIAGSMSVLGLITVSVEFRMGLVYNSATPGKLKGYATLTVKVKVLFFNKTVTIGVERTIRSSPNDPTFKDAMTLADWAYYLESFA